MMMLRESLCVTASKHVYSYYNPNWFCITRDSTKAIYRISATSDGGNTLQVTQVTELNQITFPK